MSTPRERYEAMMDFAEQWIRKGQKDDINAALAAIEWCKEFRISEAGKKLELKNASKDAKDSEDKPKPATKAKPATKQEAAKRVVKPPVFDLAALLEEQA